MCSIKAYSSKLVLVIHTVEPCWSAPLCELDQALNELPLVEAHPSDDKLEIGCLLTKVTPFKLTFIC